MQKMRPDGKQEESSKIGVKIRPDPRIREFLSVSLTHDDIDEMAIPSYFHWNPLVRWIIAERLNEIVRLGDFRRSDVVLDFGTGTGILLSTLSTMVREVIATDLRTDLARRMLGLKDCKNVRIIELEEFEQIPPRSISKIVAADVLEHVKDLDQVIDKFSTILQRGGELIVSGPTETPLYKVCRKVARFSGQYHLRSIFEIEESLYRKGFKLKVKHWLPPLLPFKLFAILVLAAPDTRTHI